MKHSSNTNFKPFPTLVTTRLVLRQIELSDADDFFAIRSNVQVMKALDKISFKHIDEAREFISLISEQVSNGSGIRWAICLKGNNVLIGCLGYHNINFNTCVAEIGYELLPAFHNQGIASEAMKSVLEFAFKSLMFTGIEAGINPENLISIKLLTKHGFAKSRSTVGDYYFDGRYLDSDYYSLTNPYI